ncbi:MAG: LemA family protein [Planctomycetes bacterium]|nr:LemA family protein [Planctomycetota bacterium]
MTRRSSISAILLAVIVALLAVFVIGGGCAISGYNKVVGLREAVDGAWAQVENQLQRRFDLIPNVVETVKGYAAHESEIFKHVADARTQYFQAAQGGSRKEQVAAATGFERALSRLLVLQEKYPDLKAQQQFQALMVQLEGTENRIAVERKRYNDSVRSLNTYRRRFFGRIISGWAGIEGAEYFETPKEAQQAPQVDFTGGE